MRQLSPILKLTVSLLWLQQLYWPAPYPTTNKQSSAASPLSSCCIISVVEASVMLRLSVQLLLVATVVHSSQFHASPFLSLSNPPAGVECSDGVCSIVPSASVDSTKADVIDLEDKVLKEWKAAGPAEPSSDKSSMIVPSASAIEAMHIPESRKQSTVTGEAATVFNEQSVEIVAPPTPVSVGDAPVGAPEEVEPSDLESKISELKKMGFAAADAKTALKLTGYDVSEAAATLELEEEEKEIIREKALEIGKGYF